MPAEMMNKKGEPRKQTVPNPVYMVWVCQDQQVLGFMMSSLSREMLTQVVSMTTLA
jgi:hypothetical protein